MPRYIFLLLLASLLHTATAQTTTTVYDERSGISHWIVSDILQDRNGFIWMSTWNGLNRFDGYEFRQVKSQPGDGNDIQSEVIRQIDLDDKGDIICLSEGGRFLLDTRTYRLKPGNDTSVKNRKSRRRPVRFTDREGNRWQIERYGVTKTSHTVYPAHRMQGTEGTHARAFLKDRKRRWWLTTKEDEAIRLYDSRNRRLGYLGPDGRLHKEKTPFGYRAYSILETHDGDIWIGCKPGALLRLREKADGTYDIRRFGESLPCDTIYDIIEDRKGRLWLATFGGGTVCVTAPASGRPSFTSFTRNEGMKGRCKMRRLLLTRQGNIVCATTNGLVTAVIDEKDIRKTVFRRLSRNGKDAGSIAGNAVMDVVQDSRGRIFIATENNGVDMTDEKSLFSGKPRFTHFNTSNSSLTSDACRAMTLKDDGRLLIVCTDRVMDFSPEEDKTVTYSRNFWSAESHFSEVRPMMLYDGSWLFGQEQGAYVATRRAMETSGYVPPLLFTELSVSGKRPRLDVCNAETITIKPDDRNFSLSFASLDYTDNTGILYRSKVDHAPWSHATADRSLTFHDIKPGEHVLMVQSTDRYGRWTDNTRRLLIIVKPRWYETLLARILGWLFFAGMITGGVYTVFHVRELHRQRRELLEKYMALLDKSEDSVTETAATHGGSSLPAGLSEADRRFLDSVRKYIEENIGNSDADIDEMAACAATSRSNLNRKLRSLVGITAAQLLIDARMQRAAQLLGKKDGERPTVTETAYRCGYSDPRYFSRCFKQKYGVSPSEFEG
ncbi:MAG: helix-turn-helix domain-containing protein [Prevotella sp.]|nr:helix-turn-helix domain-containing protein [Prevotella sp.]